MLHKKHRQRKRQHECCGDREGTMGREVQEHNKKKTKGCHRVFHFATGFCLSHSRLSSARCPAPAPVPSPFTPLTQSPSCRIKPPVPIHNGEHLLLFAIIQFIFYFFDLFSFDGGTTKTAKRQPKGNVDAQPIVGRL